MPLQSSTIGVCHALLRFSEQMVLACSAKISRTNVSSCTMWFRRFTKYVTKYDFIPHSNEQDTLPIAFLITRQVVPYQTRGGTYYPGGSTPKIRSLADSSTTCHNSINHLHHSNRCLNHNIDPHMANSHFDGWKTTTLSQAKLNITKDRKTWMTPKTTWLSITNQV
jgi:hypothetical protein